MDAYEDELQEPLASHPVAAQCLANITNRPARPPRRNRRAKPASSNPPASTRMGRMKPPAATGTSPELPKNALGRSVDGRSVNTYLAHVFGRGG